MKLFHKEPLDYSLAKQDKYDVLDADADVDDDPATFRRQSRRWRRLRVNICLFYLTLRSGSGLVGSWWAIAPWLQILFEFAEETLTGNSKIHFLTNKGWTHSPGKQSR